MREQPLARVRRRCAAYLRRAYMPASIRSELKTLSEYCKHYVSKFAHLRSAPDFTTKHGIHHSPSRTALHYEKRMRLWLADIEKRMPCSS